MTTKKLLNKLKSKSYGIRQSSLGKITTEKVTYEQCRRYACENIAKSLTHIPKSKAEYIEIPKGTDYHFIGRVDTNSTYENDPKVYYHTFMDRSFISFSTINKQNISHYRGAPFFIYDIIPEDILHIFPIDSNTDRSAKKEEELTRVPSLWLTLSELDEITKELQVYNQITCRTKRNGKIIKPIGIISFSQEDEEQTHKIAKQFGIKQIKVHPEEGAINYSKDLLYDAPTFKRVSNKILEKYEIPVDKLFFEI